MKTTILKAVISASFVLSCLPSQAAPLKYLTDKQIQDISLGMSYVICNAKAGRQSFPGISSVDQSLLKAWEMSGVPVNDVIIAGSHLESIEKNTKKLVDSRDPQTCRQMYQVSYEAPENPNGNVYSTPPRQIGNINRCKSYLSSKYGIYTKGQLQDCVAKASRDDFMNGVPLTAP